MEAILQINQLNLSYSGGQDALLRKVNLHVNRGECIVVLGENGAGKSTLLKSLAGLIKPNSGEVLLQGKSIQKWGSKELAKRIAFVNTNVQFSELLKVQEFVAFGRYPFTNWLGKLDEQSVQLLESVMQKCGLNKLKDQRVSEISDGELQKVMVARALVQQTELLLLDEPTTHLDIKNSLAILKILKEESIQKNNTILFSTHQVESALHIADKIWLCYEKTVISVSPEEFIQSGDLQKKVFGDSYQFDQTSHTFKIRL